MVASFQFLGIDSVKHTVHFIRNMYMFVQYNVNMIIVYYWLKQSDWDRNSPQNSTGVFKNKKLDKIQLTVGEMSSHTLSLLAWLFSLFFVCIVFLIVW